MKNGIKITVIAVCLAVISTGVRAQSEASAEGEAGGFDFVSKVAFGQKSMDLSIRDRSFNPTFNTLDLTLTVLKDRYFVSLNHEISIKDPIGIGFDNVGAPGLIFYSRTDTNLTFGYSINDWLGAFIGFRRGETEANFSTTNSSFGNSSDGFYLGVSGSHFVEGRGNFGATFAVAQLNGEVALTEPFVDTSVFLVGNPPPASITGSALGFSLGLSWTTQISEDSLFTTEIKIHQYSFEDDVVFGGLDLSYEENFSTFYIALTHFF